MPVAETTPFDDFCDYSVPNEIAIPYVSLIIALPFIALSLTSADVSSLSSLPEAVSEMFVGLTDATLTAIA